MGRLEGKVAIITGAASGMGRAAVQLFAQEGAAVVAGDITEAALQTAVEEATSRGGVAIARRLDVASPESWNETVEATLAAYGRIDILVNNAGVTRIRGILDGDMDDWDFVMGINLTGVMLGMKAVIPQMKAQGGGSIVNTSSIAALVGGLADVGSAAYSASKGGVRSLTKHAAQWHADDNIRVNSVHPGAIFTGIVRDQGITSQEEMGAKFGGRTPLPPHAGEPFDIAYGYLYLASDEAKFVTGSEFVIDGGWTSA
jgi:NAD(P)-dependent dehydrogenase (short-subunit alcohol dehydrogenase family)